MLLRAITTSDGGTNENNSHRALAIEALEAKAPILKYLQWRSIKGNADTLRQDDLIVGAGESRTANSEYDGIETTTPEVTATLQMLGGLIKTDLMFERRHGADALGSERSRKIKRYCESLGRHFTDKFFNGGGVGDQMQGIKGLASGDNLIAMGDNGANVSLGSDNTSKKEQQALLAKIDQLLAETPGAQFLAMDGLTKARLKAIAREYVTVTTAKDAFGVNQEVLDYQGVPIITAGMNSANDARVIPHNEVKGSASTCTSIYAVTPGEDTDLCLITSNGLNVKDLGLVGVWYTTFVEFDVNTMLLNAKAVGRLEGIIINS